MRATLRDIGTICWGFGVAAALLFISLGSWATSLLVCIHQHRLGLLYADSMWFPVGIVHGIGIWLGIWH